MPSSSAPAPSTNWRTASMIRLTLSMTALRACASSQTLSSPKTSSRQHRRSKRAATNLPTPLEKILSTSLSPSANNWFSRLRHCDKRVWWSGTCWTSLSSRRSRITSKCAWLRKGKVKLSRYLLRGKKYWRVLQSRHQPVRLRPPQLLAMASDTPIFDDE